MNQPIKVLIDQSRLITGHKARGSGTYINNLINSLSKNDAVKLVNNYSSGPSIVHFPYFDPFFLTLPNKNILPTVITVHDLIPIDYPKIFPKGIKGWLKWQVQKKKLQHADAIITDSIYSKRRISDLAGIKNEKIYVIPLAADPQFRQLESKILNNVREKYLLPQKFILYVGDVNPNKNLKRLVQASEKFKLKLYLAGRAFGSDSIEVLEIKKLIEKSKNCSVIGEITSNEDLVAIYNLAYLTVVPSWEEGFGFPVLESMACGTPVALSNSSCLPEVGNDAAKYFDPFSIDNIIKVVNEICVLNKKEYLELKNRSLSNNKEFTWSKTAQLTIDVYTQLKV